MNTARQKEKPVILGFLLLNYFRASMILKIISKSNKNIVITFNHFSLIFNSSIEKQKN